MLSLSVASLYLSEAASRHCQNWQIIPPFTAEHPRGLEGSARRSRRRILNRYLVNISYRGERGGNILQQNSQKQRMFVWLPVHPQQRQKIVLQPCAEARRLRCMGCIACCVDANTYSLLSDSPLCCSRWAKMKWIWHLWDTRLSVCAPFICTRPHCPFSVLILHLTTSYCELCEDVMVKSNLVSQRDGCPNICIDFYQFLQ